MAKIIIHYDDDMAPESALWRVLGVVRRGRVSEAGGVKHFCWASKFADGSWVWALRKKPKQIADSFKVVAADDPTKTEEKGSGEETEDRAVIRHGDNGN